MGPVGAGTGPFPPAPGERVYVRPAIPESIYRSPGGSLIPYGHRWDEDGPAPDSYSVMSHPERFAGPRLVAYALIDHLSAAYEVDMDDDPACAGAYPSSREWHPRPRHQVARAFYSMRIAGSWSP
jgi:hypothetical protein